MKGNTVGSQLQSKYAYIAGFFDGDGSLMLQLKKRSDTKLGFRFMVTICLYQDSRHDKPLYWIREVFSIGYIHQRNDNITELRINGYRSVRRILKSLQPYVRFKKVQLNAVLKACDILIENDVRKLTKSQLTEVADLIVLIQNQNYKSRYKRSREEIYKTLGLTP